MNTSQDSKRLNWEKWGAIAGIIGTLITLATLVSPSRGGMMNFLSNNWPYLAIVMILIVSVTVLTYAITRKKLMAKLQQSAEILRQGESDLMKAREVLEQKQKELEVCQSEIVELKSKPVPYYKRFEGITRIRYGHIEYDPLLYHTLQGEPLGIGITILKEIFRNNGIEKHAKRMFWEDIESLLYEK